MTRIIFFVLGLFVMTGCTKEAAFHTDLAMDQRVIVAPATADTVNMVVYSSGSWTMEAIDAAPWATISKGSGSGKAYATVITTDNSANLPRSARFVVKSGAKADTVQLGQKGIVPTIAITATSVAAPAAGGAIQTAINTNLPLNIMSVGYIYDANGSDWISGLQIANNNLSFNVAANGTTAARTATIFLSYLDAIGSTAKDSLKVTQPKP
ncbi:MAG: BACON domain-containing protein [Niabella sp.]|nr:BACON domain-containing protein [Niabella sp.]